MNKRQHDIVTSMAECLEDHKDLETYAEFDVMMSKWNTLRKQLYKNMPHVVEGTDYIFIVGRWEVTVRGEDVGARRLDG